VPADHELFGEPPVGRLIQATVLLLVSAAATLLLAANRGNQVVLGLVALGAIPVPALCYMVARLHDRAKRRRAETAAFSHLRGYLDNQKSEWRQASVPAPPLPELRRMPRSRMAPPRPVTAFREMSAGITPRAADPVLVVFEALAPIPQRRVVAPRLSVVALLEPARVIPLHAKADGPPPACPSFDPGL